MPKAIAIGPDQIEGAASAICQELSVVLDVPISNPHAVLSGLNLGSPRVPIITPTFKFFRSPGFNFLLTTQNDLSKGLFNSVLSAS